MSDIDEIVDVQITVSDKAAALATFDIPLLLGYHTRWLSDFVREYAEADDMLDDGFTTNDALYLAAQAIKGQDPCPKTFKVGRRAVALTQVIKITPTNTTPGFKHVGTIGGQAYTYTNGGSETATTIAAALTAIINPFTAVNAAAVGPDMTVTNATAGNTTDFSIGRGCDVLDMTVDTTTDDELAVIRAEDDAWYGLLVIDSQSKATALLAAAATEPVTKECIFQTADSACLDGSSVVSTTFALKNAAYKRTGVIYHRLIGGTEWLAAGWMSRTQAITPGSGTPALKTVAGVSADDPKIVNAGARSALEANNASWYLPRGGINVTFEGKAASGRFLDITRFVDWQQDDMQSAVFFFMANSEKVEYDDNGISQIKGVMLQSLQRGVKAKGLASNPEPAVTVSAALEQSTNDRALRIARDFGFSGRLGGAIHRAVIRGNLNV